MQSNKDHLKTAYKIAHHQKPKITIPHRLTQGLADGLIASLISTKVTLAQKKCEGDHERGK